VTDVHQQRMLITARHGHPVTHGVAIVTIEDSIAPCPLCGNDDLDAWANDGEADAADWWECRRCGHSGAFLHTDPSKNTTPNGLPAEEP
jgi:hypothetical protein